MGIRLIVSDLDGTLLQNGAQQLNGEVFPLIHQLEEQKILFVAASGRQYPNLRKLFLPVAEQIGYICENGGLIMYGGRLIRKCSVEKELGVSLIHKICTMDGCEVLVSGQETSYVSPKEDAYEAWLRNVVGNQTTRIDRFEDIEEEFIKISLYCRMGITNEMREELGSLFGGRLNMVRSQEEWLDFTSPEANKGQALMCLQKQLGIPKEETMVFGDNENDLEMFQRAEYGFAMENAICSIKKAGRYSCKRVEDIWKAFLDGSLSL